jgi:hypothetical protein
MAFNSLEYDPSALWTTNPDAPYHQFAAFIKQTLLEKHNASTPISTVLLQEGLLDESGKLVIRGIRICCRY